MSVADPFRGYREEVGFGLMVGDGPFLREIRQRLSTLILAQAQRAKLEHFDLMGSPDRPISIHQMKKNKFRSDRLGH
jgi:hypothetical protein